MPKEAGKDLSIVLVPERPFYLSGDQLKGSVRFECPDTRSVKRIEISFWGRLKSAITEKHPLATIYTTYRDRVWLFEESEDLLSGENTVLEPGPHTWPFSFTIPTSVTPWKVETWDVGPTLERFPEQPLPPSYHFNAKAKGVISGHYSITSYALVVKIHFVDGALPTKETRRLLNVIPVSDTAPPTSEHQHQATYEARGHDLLPEHERPRETTAKKDFRQLLAKQPPPPTLRLRLTASHPIYLAPTRPWKLSLRLDITPPRPHDIPLPTPPTFHLTSARARIKAKSTVSITRTAEHSRTHSATVAEAELSDLTDAAIVPGQEKALDMGRLAYVPASINLSSLSRRYVMHLVVVVETATTADRGAHVFKLEGKAPVVVEPLPPEARGEDGGEAAEMVKGGIAMAALDDVGGVLDVGLGVFGLVTL